MQQASSGARAGRPSVRRLDDTAAPLCVALAQSVGWQSDESRWRITFAVGEAYGVDLDGVLAGTVVLHRFGERLASIAMMMVGAPYQRRGLGRVLMEHALARAGESVVCLYATDEGRPLYERLGFVAGDCATRWEGGAREIAAPPAPHPGLRPMRDADMPAVRALDEEAQGAPRSALLAVMREGSDRAFVVERSGALVGFGLSLVASGLRMIGPIVARDDADACALATRLAVGAEHPLRIEAQPGERALVAWARASGLTRTASTPLMVLRGVPLPGRRHLVRALAGRAFG